jgi:hypothetical protein
MPLALSELAIGFHKRPFSRRFLYRVVALLISFVAVEAS